MLSSLLDFRPACRAMSGRSCGGQTLSDICAPAGTACRPPGPCWRLSLPVAPRMGSSGRTRRGSSSSCGCTCLRAATAGRMWHTVRCMSGALRVHVLRCVARRSMLCCAVLHATENAPSLLGPWLEACLPADVCVFGPLSASLPPTPLPAARWRLRPTAACTAGGCLQSLNTSTRPPARRPPAAPCASWRRAAGSGPAAPLNPCQVGLRAARPQQAAVPTHSSASHQQLPCQHTTAPDLC